MSGGGRTRVIQSAPPPPPPPPPMPPEIKLTEDDQGNQRARKRRYGLSALKINRAGTGVSMGSDGGGQGTNVPNN